MQHIKLFFREEMSGPENGRFRGYITTDTLFLGAGTSTGATATCRTPHSPLFNRNCPSHWYVYWHIICFCIPILRRMRCGGGENYTPNLPPRH